MTKKQATNHAGYQVESYDRFSGWRRASKVFTNYHDACRAYDQMKVRGRNVVEFRIMEALHPAPLTPMQWLGELGKRVKRFYFKGVL